MTEYLLYANIALLIGFVISLIMRGLFFWKVMRKQTFAIIVDKDKNTKAVKTVDTRRKFFSYDGNSYNVGVPYIKVGNKKYLLYLIGVPDHIDFTMKKHKGLSADAYESILKTEMIKKINKSEGLFGNLDWKKVAMLVGGGIVVYMLLSGGVV